MIKTFIITLIVYINISFSIQAKQELNLPLFLAARDADNINNFVNEKTKEKGTYYTFLLNNNLLNNNLLNNNLLNNNLLNKNINNDNLNSLQVEKNEFHHFQSEKNALDYIRLNSKSYEQIKMLWQSNNQNINKQGMWTEKYNSNTCLTEFYERDDLFLCKTNEINLMKPNISNLLAIFCNSLAPNYKDYTLKRIKSSKEHDNKSVCKLLTMEKEEINKLELFTAQETELINNILPLLNKDFNQINISYFVQKLMIDNTLYTIENTHSSITSNDIPEKKNSSFTGNFIGENLIKFSDKLNECINNKRELKNDRGNKQEITQIGTCKIPSINESQGKINMLLYEHYKNIKWECKTTDEEINIKLYPITDADNNFKYHLTPFLNLVCNSSKAKNPKKIIFNFDILDEKIIGNIKNIEVSKNIDGKLYNSNMFDIALKTLKLSEENTYELNELEKKLITINYYENNPSILNEDGTIFNSTSIKEYKKHTYLHLNRLQRLFSIVLSNCRHKIPKRKMILHFDTWIDSDNYAKVDQKNNILKLKYDSSLKKHPANDSSTIAHEFSHIIIPDILSISNNVKRNLFNNMFHDLAETISISANNISCVGQYMEKDNLCNDIDSNALPRKIDKKSSYFNKLLHPLQFDKDDYYRNQIVARMFQIALTTQKKESSLHNLYPNNEVLGILRHWIRLVRSITIYNFQKIPCELCDLDFYLAQQNLMRAYLQQFKYSSDKNLYHKLLYLWSIEGYSNIHYSCIDSLSKIDGCKISKNTLVNEYTGLALTYSIVNKKDKKIILKTHTGMNYLFKNGTLKKHLKKCNAVKNIVFYNEKGQGLEEYLTIERNDINENDIHKEDFCLTNIEFTGTYYTKITDGKDLKKIYFSVETCEKNSTKCIYNVDSDNPQDLPTLL